MPNAKINTIKSKYYRQIEAQERTEQRGKKLKSTASRRSE
jgi:hypothetical protein